MPALLWLLPTAAGAQALADGPRLALYAGYHGIEEAVDSAEFGLELRIPELFWRLRPVAGYLGTTDSSQFVYGGLRWEFEFAPGFDLSPSVGLGHYERGDGLDLGNHLMFRLGFDVTRTLGDFDVGLGFYHLSNAGTGDFNPGIESVLFTVSYGF